MIAFQSSMGTGLVMGNKWAPYPVETAPSTGRNILKNGGRGTRFPIVIVFICHISMQPHLYYGGWQPLDAWCIVSPTAVSKFPKEIGACLRFTFINEPCLLRRRRRATLATRRAPPPPRDFIKVSPKHALGVCVAEAITHTTQADVLYVIPRQFINISCCV